MGGVHVESVVMRVLGNGGAGVAIGKEVWVILSNLRIEGMATEDCPHLGYLARSHNAFWESSGISWARSARTAAVEISERH